MFAALCGTGIRPGDEFFCPSSPAWGHGLWHGTLAPLALGVTTGTFAGRFDAVRLELKGASRLQDHQYVGSGHPLPDDEEFGQSKRLRLLDQEAVHTGEPIDPATLEFIDQTFHVPACSMYGTTEIGVCWSTTLEQAISPSKARLVGQAGARSEAPGAEAGCTPTEPGAVGELMLWATRPVGDYQGPREDRRRWLLLSCRSGGRLVIISAVWTMSAVEIENTLLKAPGCERSGRRRRAGCNTRASRQRHSSSATARPSDDYVDELKTFHTRALKANTSSRVTLRL